MSNTTIQSCVACGKTPESTRKAMLVCSRCQEKGKRQVHYCSRECQVSSFPQHKPFCGLSIPTASSFPAVLDPDAAFQPPPALLFHLAALTTLPPSAFPDSSPPPSFLYFPTTPTPAVGSSSRDPPMPVPISLPPAARSMFSVLQLTAFKTGNALAVNLMYSLLLTEVEALGGVENRLIEQLAEEYRLDGVQEVGGVRRKHLRDQLEDEEEPTEAELMEAIGGEENAGVLFEWQMSEAEKTQL